MCEIGRVEGRSEKKKLVEAVAEKNEKKIFVFFSCVEVALTSESES